MLGQRVKARRQLSLAAVIFMLTLVSCAAPSGGRPADVAPTATAAVSSTAMPAGTPAPSVTAVAAPSGWNPRVSGEGLMLTLKPDHGGVGSGVEIEGQATPSLLIGHQVTVMFWPDGPTRSLGDMAQTKYTGPVWPSSWTLHVDSSGHFRDIVKVPRVIRAPSGVLQEIEPGQHYFVLLVDSAHATFAPFRVDAPPPPQTTSSPPAVQFRHTWLVDVKTGWLSGLRCQSQPAPTPDANANIAAPPPQVCEGVVDGTTDGGRTWRRQYLGHVQVGAIQFVDRNNGWAVGLRGTACFDRPCQGALLRTTDGGGRWTEIYTTTLGLTNLAFTSSKDGWLLGRACTGRASVNDCTGHVLMTADGGRTWQDSALPIHGSALALAHPTAADGWIAASLGGPGESQLIATHDGGETWQSLPNPAGRDFPDEQQLYFLTSEQGWLLAAGQPSAGQQMKAVYGTTDGGKTWTELARSGFGGDRTGAHGSLPSGGYAGPIVFPSSKDGWIASPRGGLLHSADGGKTWQGAATDDHYFVEVRFADTRNGWALSLEGPGLWTTADGGATWTKVALPEQ